MKKYDRKDDKQLWFEIFPEYESQPKIENPKNESERYINAQSRWIEEQSEEAWAEMWSIIDILARKALTIECHHSSLKFSQEKKEAVVLDVCSMILERYRQWRGYRIDFIATQVRLAVKLELYKRKSKEQFELSLAKAIKQGLDYETALQVAQQEVLEFEKGKENEDIHQREDKRP